jgi:hypothetical protein
LNENNIKLEKYVYRHTIKCGNVILIHVFFVYSRQDHSPPANYLCEIHSENKLYQRTMKLKLGYGDMHECAHVNSMVNEPRLYGNRKTGLITKT